MNKQEILDAIKGMTVLELSELVKALEEEFGVSAAAPVAVEAAPKAVKEGVAKEEAESIKAKFAEVGAKVEIK